MIEAQVLTPISHLFDVPALDLPVSARTAALVQVTTKKTTRARSKPHVVDLEQSLVQLHTRLYLYAALTNAIENLPEDVRAEIVNARLMCRVALTFLHVLSRDATRLLPALRAVAEDEQLDGLDVEAKTYIQNAITYASFLVTTSDECGVLQEIIEATSSASRDDVDPREVVLLAAARLGYAATRAQPAIHALRELASKSGQVGVAANYLLAEVYGRLALPLEQLRALDEWWQGLTKLHNAHPATIAGGLARKNHPGEQALLRGAAQYAKLLRANGQTDHVGDITQQFRNAGYAAVLDIIVDQPRVAMACTIIDPTTDRDAAKQWVYEILTSASAQEGCLLARDASAPETFPGSIDVASDVQFRRDVAAAVASSGMDMDESLLPVPFDTRRWILFRASQPFECVAAGFLPIGKDTGVVFWRAAIFSATSLSGKGNDWFQSLAQAVNKQGDPLTMSAIREAIRGAIAGRRRSARPKIIK